MRFVRGAATEGRPYKIQLFASRFVGVALRGHPRVDFVPGFPLVQVEIILGQCCLRDFSWLKGLIDNLDLEVLF